VRGGKGDRDEIFALENINITKILTTSSLVVTIFTANFLTPDHSIYNIRVFSLNFNLGLSYPQQQKILDKLFLVVVKQVWILMFLNVVLKRCLNCYDINSLYSYIMAIKDFPVGEPIFSYDQNLDNYFGFVYCSIETPINLDKPVLPFRDNEGNIYNPLGN